METIPLPQKIELTPGAESGHATLTIEPLFPGYGVTVGNALRRVMLSSLPGAAITDVKISGALHEFSTVPNVKEDVLDVILNLKQVRMKLHGEESAKLTLRVKGAKKVTAKDFEANARVEIANPGQYICTTTDPKTNLELEVTIEAGKGYSPTEERNKSEREAGVIAIDALFSPVRFVGLKIDAVRVGQQTNFERVTMGIETDGTIAPEEAVQKSIDILLSHFNLLQGVVMGEAPARATVEVTEEVAVEPSAEEVSLATTEEPAAAPKKRGRPKKKSNDRKLGN